MNPLNNSKNALTETDIDQLSEWLEALNESCACVSLEALDGIAAALAVMTRTVTLTELIPILLETINDATDEISHINDNINNDNDNDNNNDNDNDNDNDKNINRFLNALTKAQQAELAKLITRRVHHTTRLLSNSTIADLSDPRAYQPWVIDYEQLILEDTEFAAEHKNTEFSPLAAEWAVGFVSTVEHFAQDWRMTDDLLDDELNPMLAPIYALALPRDEWPEDIREQDVAGDSREAWLAQAIWACYELWEYWRYHAPKPKLLPIVHERTPGRNDACHCGSSKKFKVCHGK